MWCVLCCVDDPAYFATMIIDVSKCNITAQITPFAHFHFLNRYIVEISPKTIQNNDKFSLINNMDFVHI